MDYIKRQRKLLGSLRAKNLDALLVRKRQNISYLTGVRGEDAILFFSGKERLLITDPRYKEEYTKSIKNCHLRIAEDKDLRACIQLISKKTHSMRIGFESNNFSYSEYTGLKKTLKKSALVPTKDMLESLRMIKDKDEITYLKKACKNGCDVMNYALKIVRPCFSEETVKGRIEAYIAKKGTRKADFDIIVASGRNAAMPHAPASKRNIAKGEMVIIDLGTMDYGYNCDLTRTIFLDRINGRYSRVYNVVLDAQKKAIKGIRPGVKAKYIDNISRQYIIDKGLGQYFVHSLGHGIGLEVHEKPHISKNSNAILEKGMIVTIEPGVYIPGWGGVRIEDVVLVTEDGCEVLTKGCPVRTY